MSIQMEGLDHATVHERHVRESRRFATRHARSTARQREFVHADGLSVISSRTTPILPRTSCLCNVRAVPMNGAPSFVEGCGWGEIDNEPSVLYCQSILIALQYGEGMNDSCLTAVSERMDSFAEQNRHCHAESQRFRF